MAEQIKAQNKKKQAIFIGLLIVIIAIVMGWIYWIYLDNNPSSDDAEISAYVVNISPAIPGKLQKLHVKEGDRVNKGDLLFSLDPHNYELTLKQSKAELAVAKATLDTRQRQVRAEQANADIAKEQINRARVNLELADSTLHRLEPLAAKGFVPKQELDTARTAANDARISLIQAQSQAQAAQELVGKLEAAQAAVEMAEASVGLAEKALADTKVYAPDNGLIVGLKVSAGEHLAPGQSLFTLINTDNWYATAFYRETDLPEIHVGNCAEVYTMMQPDTKMSAKVVSKGWGVATDSAIDLPRFMPIVQKSLNWVRVAQRFPVRVKIDEPIAELMRVGASATVVIRADQQC